MTQGPQIDDERGSRQRVGSPAAGCCYELEYVTTEEQSAHEPWLYEWVLDCIEIDDIAGISVSRDDGHRHSVSIEIQTRSTHGLCVLDERYQARISDLADRVDELVVSRCVGDGAVTGGQ